AFAAKKASGRADAPPSPARRRFIDNAITAAGVAPFVAGGYGILYGRLNLETTHPRVPIARLPKAFHGFRIAQLTDIHIGPFMTADQIRRYVSIANEARVNLIGIDFHRPQRGGIFGAESLAEVKPLLLPDTTNILLSHNPNNFDRAAELGVDLTLSGHTHGGQAALEFISPNLAPSRLITPYVAGHFSKSTGQLYVNR